MKQLFIFLLALGTLTVFSQVHQQNIIGVVKDGNNTPIVGASVVLLNSVDSVLVSFASTELDGSFILKRVKSGEYRFQISYLGYGTIEKMVKVAIENLNMGVITLTETSNVLEEVKITAEFTPIVIKKDTIEYNADAYRVRPNATVEELLKKLPGIEVDDQGVITAQGEEVKRVTVDGKKFFGDDPKMATKNLPADAIKKVQVFDKKSDRAEFTGISDGETEKTINLELKADKKIGTFGEIAAGIGSKDRFESKFSLNKFNAKYQIASLINFNNVSNQGFSFSDYSALMGQNPFSRGGGNSGLVNSGNNSGQIKSVTGGLNLYYEFSKKLNVNTNYFITYADQFLIRNTDKENVNGTESFFSYDDAENNSLRKQHNVNLNFQLKPDSFTRMDFESFVRFNFNNSDARTLSGTSNADLFRVADNIQSDVSDSDVQDLSFRLNITRRLKKAGRIVSLNTQYGLAESESDYHIDRSEYDYIASLRERILQEQISRNDNKNFNINAEYKEPLGNKNYVGLVYSLRNYSTDFLKDFYDIDTISSIKTLNNELTANSFNDILYNKYGVNYTKDNDDYSLNANFMFQRSALNWNDGSETLSPLNKKYNYFLPSLNFNWTAKNLRFRYSTSVDEPSANQLQPIVNNSDPLNLYVGNPELRPEYSHSFNIRYNFFDNFNFRNLFAFITFRHTKDKIVNAQAISSNFVRTISPVNTASSQNINLNVSYSTPIRKLTIKSRIFGNMSVNKSFNFINAFQNEVVSTRPRLGLELENLKNKVVSLVVGSEIAYEQNRYSQSTALNTSFTTNRYWSNLLVQFGEGWTLDGNVNHTVYSQERFGEDNTLTFINTSFSKRFYKDRIIAAFRINDILNTGSGITRAIGDTYVEEVYTNAIGRYIMFTVTYKLSAFNPQNAIEQGARRMMR